MILNLIDPPGMQKIKEIHNVAGHKWVPIKLEDREHEGETEVIMHLACPCGVYTDIYARRFQQFH